MVISQVGWHAMHAQRWQHVRILFDQLVELPAEARAQQLSNVCQGDIDLEQELIALLDADASSVGMTSARQAVLADIAAQEESAECSRLAGMRLGAFRLLREIAHGGMGSVWLAERADGQFTQKVAVKLMRSGWDRDEISARFRTERQILANLQHPNIAHLIDGGVTPEGNPWLALEYVEGVDLRRYCDEHNLNLRQRAGLFMSVCEAVAYAHARLIVHRDLKPSNIMVDKEGEVKLLDFGIAKLLDAESAQTTSLQVFTPEYAAPEQVRGETVTTAVDIYALGVVLYELLTGRYPYKLSKISNPTECARAVLDQVPKRPSQAITQNNRDPEAATLAAHRLLSPHRLRRELQGDLDAIVMKAMRKEPAQRYTSVQELASDLGAWLKHRPVAARSGGWRYGISCFVRRHIIGVAAAASALLALGLGLGVALWQAKEAREQRDLARSEKLKSDEALQFLTGLFDLADPHKNLGQNVTARELLAHGKKQIETELVDEPDARATLLGALGKAYIGLGLHEEALPLLEECLRLRREQGDRDHLVQAMFDYGRALAEAGHMRDDLALMREAATLIPDTPENAKLTAEIEYRLATQLYNLSQYPESEALYRSALARERALDGHYNPKTVINFVALLRITDRSQEGEALTREALKLAREHLPDNDPTIPSLLGSLAQDITAQGRPAEAEPLVREALAIKYRVFGEDHPQTLVTLNSLGATLDAAGNLDEARDILNRVLESRRKVLGEDHKDLASPLNNLGRVETKMGRYEEAKAHYEEAQRLVLQHYGPEDMVAGIVSDGLGRAKLGLGDFVGAERDLRRALEVIEKIQGKTSLRLTGSLIDLARLQLEQGQIEAACEHAHRANDIERARKQEPGAYARLVLGGCLLAQGQQASASALIRAADADLRKKEPNNRYARAAADAYLRKLAAISGTR